MNTSLNRVSTREFLNNLVEKCWESPDFLTNLVLRPQEEIENYLESKINLPSDVSLFVNDQTDESKYYLNIPSVPQLDNMSLSDEELDVVAGGEIGFSIASGIIIAGTLGLLGVSIGSAIANSVHGDPSYNCQ